jgi:predicted transcriptional regulator
MTNEQIIDEMKSRMGVETDKELADKLGVSKQAIHTFKSAKGSGVAVAIVHQLLKM